MSFLLIAAIPVLCCGSNAGIAPSNVTPASTFETSIQASHSKVRVFRSFQKADKPGLTLAQGGYYNPYYRNYPPRYNPYYAPRYNPYYPPRYNQRNSAQYRHYLRMQSLRYRGQINTNSYNSRQRANDRQHKRFIESIRK